MADLTYGEQLPVDDAGKKFLGVAVNNGGVNEFAAVSGENRRSLNGEIVADMNINVRNMVTGGMNLANFDLNTDADEQALDVDDTVGGVQFAAFDAATTHVMFTARGGEMCYTLRGAAPTASSAHRIFPHDAFVWRASMATAAKFIRGYNAPMDGTLYLTELIEQAMLVDTGA